MRWGRGFSVREEASEEGGRWKKPEVRDSPPEENLLRRFSPVARRFFCRLGFSRRGGKFRFSWGGVGQRQGRGIWRENLGCFRAGWGLVVILPPEGVENSVGRVYDDSYGRYDLQIRAMG